MLSNNDDDGFDFEFDDAVLDERDAVLGVSNFMPADIGSLVALSTLLVRLAIDPMVSMVGYTVLAPDVLVTPPPPPPDGEFEFVVAAAEEGAAAAALLLPALDDDDDGASAAVVVLVVNRRLAAATPRANDGRASTNTTTDPSMEIIAIDNTSSSNDGTTETR